MRDEPGGHDLLAAARAAFVAEILPLLSGDARYTGAMIANAMRMALHPVANEEAERKALETLLSSSPRLRGEVERGASPQRNPHPNPPPQAGEGAGRSAGGELRNLNAVLVEAIRAGRFDPETEHHEAMRAVLMSMVVDRLALANPKALEAEHAAGAVPEGFESWT